MNENSNPENWLDRLLGRTEGWVQTPHYEDSALQLKAEVIHTLSSIILVIALATISLSPFVFTKPAYGLSGTGGIIVFILLIQILNRLGRTNLASNLLVAGVWLFDTAVILLSGGFNSPFLVSYISITVMGGLILGGMYAFHLAGISVITYFVLYFLEIMDLTPQTWLVFTPIAEILTNIVNILLAATVLVMVLDKFEKNFAVLSENEETLSSINQKMAWEIAARQEAETLLRQSEDRLRSALMDSPYPTMLHTGDGEILLLNNAWIEKSGFTLKDLPALDDWLEKFYRDGRTQVEEILQELASGSEVHRDGYFNLFRKSGADLSWYLRWTQLPELPDGRNLFLTIATDLTSLQSVESALRKSEESLSKFTLVTNDGMWDWDLTSDTVDYDPRYYTMAGYEVDEFPHRLEEFRKRVHQDDVEKVFGQAKAHLQGEIDHFRVEFRFQQKDGGYLWVLGRGKITEQDEYGNPLRFAGTHTDISALKKIEEQLSQHQEHLERLVEERTQSLNERISEVERLNAALTNILDDYQIANEKLTALSSSLSSTFKELEAVTYSMSTDLQDPVLAIINNAEKLLKRPPKDISDREMKTLREILSNASLVDQRINDLLKISLLNRQDARPEHVNTRSLVEKVIQSFTEELKRPKTSLEIKDLPDCLADPGLLEQAFSCLIGNAIKFTRDETQPEIIIGSRPGKSPDKVIYYIQDNGPGFTMKDQDIVFQTFQQLHEQDEYQGAGIGLTTAKIIINKHGGEIWAEAEKGSGAAFFFELVRPLAGV